MLPSLRPRYARNGDGGVGRVYLCASTEVAEAHHLSLVFVPECQPKRRDSATNRDDGRVLQEPRRVETRLEAVVRNARREMMHVMQPDAPREPLQHRWEH